MPTTRDEADVEDAKDTDSLIGRSLEIESPKSDTAQKEVAEESSLVAKGLFCFVGLQMSYLTW